MTVAFGMSMPTSTTDVETRMAISPRWKRAMTSSFSALFIRPWRRAMRGARSGKSLPCNFSAPWVTENLQGEVFPALAPRIALLHGRMKSAEKEDVMARFQRGEIAILVSTSVVEVGIDIPNATVMMIEGADRFGLAQLHQFRGRIGRGPHQSICLLLTDVDDPETVRRLTAVVTHRSGFDLAEIDLQNRGMGELMGARQHGMSDMAMDALLQPELLSEVRV